MKYIDLKYLRLASGYLSEFHDAGNDVFRFRCPLCGDSKKSKTKTRGHIYLADKPSFHCFNCASTMPFWKFLKTLSPSLYTDYRFETFKENRPTNDNHVPVVANAPPKFRQKSLLETTCQSIKDLNDDHIAKAFLLKKKIPTDAMNDLWYCDDVRKLAAKIPGYEERVFSKRECLVIPFYSEDRHPDFIQCRFFEGNIKYQTFENSEDKDKIWGLDKIDFSKRIDFTEGPFDAMFLDNALAAGGANSILSCIAAIKKKHPEATFRIVLDNDYRTNKEVYTIAERVVSSFIPMVFYDSNFQWKDINDWVIDAGIGKEELTRYLEDRTMVGLKAKLEFSKIRKAR